MSNFHVKDLEAHTWGRGWGYARLANKGVLNYEYPLHQEWAPTTPNLVGSWVPGKPPTWTHRDGCLNDR